MVKLDIAAVPDLMAAVEQALRTMRDHQYDGIPEGDEPYEDVTSAILSLDAARLKALGRDA